MLTPKTEWLVLEPAQLLGKTVREVMPPAAAEVVHQALRDAEKLGAVWGRELALDVPDGARWFEISVARKDSPDGDRATYIVISRNVTPRKEAEERLKLPCAQQGVGEPRGRWDDGDLRDAHA